MKFRRVAQKSLINLLITRLVITLFIINFVLILLYAIGNYQGFLPETQLFLLNLIVHTSILLSLSSLCAIAYSLLNKNKEGPLFFGYGLVLIFSSLLSLIFAFLIQITKGNV